ncbi:U5 small nuclear ribonucleoprotein 40 kDa protein-like isoform X2 [Dysidea avara]|uniref:U5 small nuclear ribonucleoprotein 40 kDa protein-like isoform X2 n=1 Tax=Dysidea avara TaxID=196820 RepID=UPI00332A0570
MEGFGQKRFADNQLGGIMVPVKRARQEIVPFNNYNQQIVAAGPPRTSSLNAPIMQLFGHESEVHSARFSPTGALLASGSFDRLIFLWNVYGECENYAVLKGHSGCILELSFSLDGSLLMSASTDKTGAVWDVEVGQRVKKLKGHTSFVNSCCASRRGPQLAVTGSDDGTVKVWDIRKKGYAHSFNATFQVMSVCFNDTAEQLMSGGLDNNIKVWDLRQTQLAYTMKGHADSVTGLRLSPDGSYLLSNSMDSSLRIWDVRPYAPADRQLKIFLGAQHGFEKNLLKCAWSPDGTKVAAGSADRFVYIWDSVSRRILYKLPGHQGSVNDIDFHPKEPILLSCSSDKTIYLGELQI